MKAEFPYEMPESTQHYTMWYLSAKEELNDAAISSHITVDLMELVGVLTHIFTCTLTYSLTSHSLSHSYSYTT